MPMDDKRKKRVLGRLDEVANMVSIAREETEKGNADAALEHVELAIEEASAAAGVLEEDAT